MNTFVTVLLLLLVVVQQAHSYLPPDITVNCDESTDPSHTGYAVYDEEPSVSVRFFDINTQVVDSCTTVFSREWWALNDLYDYIGRQTITIKTSLPPVLDSPAHNISIEGCIGESDPTIENYINSRAFADAHEPCGNALNVLSRFNDYVLTVTFSNDCGESVTTTGTIYVQDTQGPEWITPPSSVDVDCQDWSLNDIFLQWLSTAGNAEVTDNCPGVSIVNDFPEESQFVCGRTYTVTFVPVDRQYRIQGTPLVATFTAAPSQSDGITPGSPWHIAFPTVDSLGNNYPSFFNYILPPGWAELGAVNPYYFRIFPDSAERTVYFSTCSSINTIAGIYIDSPNTEGGIDLVGAFNDDTAFPQDGCDPTNSFVSYLIPADTPFLVVIASIGQGGPFIQMTLGTVQVNSPATATHIDLPFSLNVNNNFAFTVQSVLPSGWAELGALNAFWYYGDVASIDRTIAASTCGSTDSIVGIYIQEGDLIGAFNDDRVAWDPAEGCDSLSSYVEYNVPAGKQFYVALASLVSPGDLDILVYETTPSVEVTCEQLIPQYAAVVITSLTTEIDGSEAVLTDLLSDIGGALTLLDANVAGPLNDLTTYINTNLGQIQDNMAQNTLQLSDSIIALYDAFGGSLSDLSNNLNTVGSDVQGLTPLVTATNTDLSNLANQLGGVPGTLNAINDKVNYISDSQLNDLTNSVNNLAGATAGGFEAVYQNEVTRFDSVAASIVQLEGLSTSISSDVQGVNAVVSQVKAYTETVNYEKYLLTSATDIGSVPWQYRTPASYLGKMDDMLNYLIQLYNSKLTACVSSSTPACVWFRSNTATPYSTLVSNYNGHVAGNRFKKAFEVLQSFYLKLFPTTLFV